MTGLRTLVLFELRAQWRTYRLLSYAVVLFVTGIGSVISLRYLPEILELSGEDFVIEFPEQHAVDAMASYGGNVVQIGTLLVVLLAMGAVARERENGIASLLLSKPISEPAYVIAKLLAHVVSLSASVLVVSAVAAAYAIGLFSGGLDAGAAWYVLTLLGFVTFGAAVTVGASCFFKSQIAAAVVALGIVIVLGIGSSIPVVGGYLPGKLLGWGSEALFGTADGFAWGALLGTIVFGVGAVLLGIRRLRTADV